MVPELDPFFTTLVTALAQRAAHGMVDAAQDAWSALVRRKLGADPKAAGALAALEQAPEDQEHRAKLAEALRRAAAGDPTFDAQLRSLWQQVNVTVHTEQRTQVSQQVTINVAAPDQPRTVPRQLPPVTVTFVNRVTELSGMDEALARSLPTGIVICVLSGMPGVGKMTTACQWAASNRDRFPGGEVLVDYTTGGAQSEAVGTPDTQCRRTEAVRAPRCFRWR